MKSSGKWHKSFGINTATMGIKMSLVLHLILTLGKWYNTRTFDLVHSVRRHSALLLCFLLITAIPRKADVSHPSRNSSSCHLFLYRPSPPLPSSCQLPCCSCFGLASPGHTAPWHKAPCPCWSLVFSVCRGFCRATASRATWLLLPRNYKILSACQGIYEGIRKAAAAEMHQHSAFKQHGLQSPVNIGISNLEDSVSRNLNTAVTTVRSDLFLNVKDTSTTEQTPMTFLAICFAQSSSGHRT